jgi:hypothetical protein
MARDPVTFNALGGLANRLRAIFSRYAPEVGMKVVWTRPWDIAGAHFLEVFEPVPGIEFIEHPGGDVEGSWGAAINPDDWHRHYALLRPRPALQEKIDRLRRNLGEYVAIHARRTDHVRLAHREGSFTTDEAFLEWVTGHDGRVFLATDNWETRTRMAAALPGRVMWQGPMMQSHATQHESRRYNSLGDAVVDLFTCVGARAFMGSAHSSFSELIVALRELQARDRRGPE